MPLSESREDWIVRELRKRPHTERPAFLDGACGGDLALRHRMEALLGSESNSVDSLEPTVADSKAFAPIQPLPTEEGPGTVIGRYRLLEKIGEGGFGTVYVAEQKEPVKRRVALKVIKLGMDTKQVVARFEAERQALAMMDHPNIAKVFDAGATDTGRPFFVMELIRGIPLIQYCDENNLDTRHRLGLFTQVCLAIQHAHQKGIIHRDIKPSNILVTVDGGIPVPKVIDFGIAKATQGELTEKTVYTQLQQFLGTPAYMSPEQAEMSSLDIDTRSDIYSLGVLLYELLVGTTPFDAKELIASGLDAMRRTIREKEPVRPSTRFGSMLEADQTTTARRRGTETQKLISLLRGDLDWIVMKSLEKDRTRRFETANGLALDIQRYLNQEPVVARPQSNLYRFQKLVLRNKLTFGAVAAVAAVLVLGTVVSTWQAVRAKRAQGKANQARLQAERSRQEAVAAQAQVVQNLYRAHMTLAFEALEAGNLARARSLVQDHFPRSGEQDLRGWEWRWLWQQCHSDELFTLGTHSGGVTRLAFFPKGDTIASAGLDDTVKLWDLESRRLLDTLGHTAIVNALALSPDGSLIATGCEDGTFRLWDAATRKVISTVTNAGDIAGLVFSSDGKTLAWAERNRAVVWDVAAHQELASYPRDPAAEDPGWKIGIAFSPDNRYLAFGQHDGRIELWEWDKNLRKTVLTGHEGRILALAFFENGQLLLSGADDSTSRIWEVGSEREIRKLTNTLGWIGSFAFSPDGKTVAAAGRDPTVAVWDRKTWEQVAVLRGHETEVWSIAFSPDGRKLVTASLDESIKVWSSAFKPQPDLARLEKATVLAHSMDGCTLLQGQGGESFSLVETATLNEVERLELPGVTNLVGAAISSDRRLLAVASETGLVRLFDPLSGRELSSFSVQHLPVLGMQISPDKLKIAIIEGDPKAKNNHTIELWDTRSARLDRVLDLGPKQPWHYSLRFSPDGRRVAVGYYDGTVELWEVGTGRQTLLPGHEHLVYDVAFSNDGKRLASTSLDRSLQLWDVETGKEIAGLGRFGLLLHLAFSPDDRRLAAGDSNGSVVLFDITGLRPQELGRLKSGHENVFEVFFASDDSLVARGDDQMIRVWRPPPLAQIDAVESAKRTRP